MLTKSVSKGMPKQTAFIGLMLLLCTVFIGQNSIYAQKSGSYIKGKVIDEENNEAIRSATVSIPSLRLGAITDAKGNFTFEAPEGDHTVEVKMIGYQTKSQRVILGKNETKEINFKISSASFRTNDIVVVGLTGEVNRNSMGNQISTVSGKDVAKIVSSSAIDAISGRVAGVNVTKNSGTPGAGTYITMRGRKSILGSSEPLYVIDGIVMDNTSLYDPSGTKQFSNRAVDINPQDIESIEILKGASAAALYGSQAANGVVLITTKRGKLSSYDKPAQVIYNSSLTFDNKYGNFPLQTKYGQATPYKPGTPGSTNSWGAELPAGTTTYAQDEVPFRTGTSHEQSLTVSGGVPQFDYLINGTFSDIMGYVEGSSLQRTNIRMNLGASLFPGVTMQNNANYIFTNNDLPQDGSNTSGILLGALRTPPNFDNTNYLEADGSQRRFAAYDNPFWTQKSNTFNQKIQRFLNSTELKWNVYDALYLNARLGMDRYEYNMIERLAVGSAGSPARGGMVDHTRITNQKYNLDFTANYNHRLMENDLALTYVLGSQIIWQDRSTDGITSTNTLPFFDQVKAGSAIDAVSTMYSKKIVGIFAQVTATYLDRVSLTGAIRRDGSSTFGDSKQFHYYPKVGLSYTLSDEEFMKDMKGTIDNVRIRMSYGEAGSPSLPDWYDTNFLYGTAGFFDPWDRESNASRGGYIGIRQGGGVSADEFVVAGAKNILPEKTIEQEIGIDLGLFDNMINLDFTYYYADIKDMILSVPVAASTGYDRELRNAAAMWNKGIEIGLSATPVKTDDFSWTTAVNYSTNSNEVTSLNIGGQSDKGSFFNLGGGFVGINNVAMVGKPLGIFRGVGWARDANGKIIYSSIENGKIINDYWGSNYVNAPMMTDSLVLLGDPNPEFQISWRNEFVIMKDLTIGFLFDAVFGFDVWNGTRGALYNFGTAKETEDRHEPWINDEGKPVLDYTDPNNPVAVTREDWYRTYGNGFVINEAHVQDGSFIKLREVNVEYRWDGLQEWNIQSVVFNFAARNLLTITDYTGYDPEVNTFSLAEGRGFDYFTLPQVTSYRFGISIIY